MQTFIEIIKAVVFGIVEGVTEWLPVSSTGHMILLNDLIPLNVSAEFYKLFEVVIQLGAILAVILLFWGKLWPFKKRSAVPKRVDRDIAGDALPSGTSIWKPGALVMWIKIVIAVFPAAVVGILFDDTADKLFYHPIPVAVALIVVGAAFIIVESTITKGKEPRVKRIADMSFIDALLVGIFQVFSAVFPGTSRSGSTIIGGLCIGLSRKTASEFSFFLAVPVMFAASLLKTVKFLATGTAITGLETAILVTGTITAFVVSLFVIGFLMDFIRKHDFKIFGWYRIALGIIVIIYSFIR